jgi:hypothetical protein
MPKQRFITFMIGTVLEAWIFSWAILSQSWFLTAFFAVFLVRRLIISYRLDKFIRRIKL